MFLWQNEGNGEFAEDSLSIDIIAHRALDTVRMGLSNDTSFSQFYFYQNREGPKDTRALRVFACPVPISKFPTTNYTVTWVK